MCLCLITLYFFAFSQLVVYMLFFGQFGILLCAPKQNIIVLVLLTHVYHRSKVVQDLSAKRGKNDQTGGTTPSTLSRWDKNPHLRSAAALVVSFLLAVNEETA